LKVLSKCRERDEQNLRANGGRTQLALETKKEMFCMTTILPHSARTSSHVPRLTTHQLKAELRKLEGETRIQREELADLIAAHQARPFMPEFIETMQRDYDDSLDELRGQIRTVQCMIQTDAQLML
jgi:hypothetical protein